MILVLVAIRPVALLRYSIPFLQIYSFSLHVIVFLYPSCTFPLSICVTLFPHLHSAEISHYNNKYYPLLILNRAASSFYPQHTICHQNPYNLISSNFITLKPNSSFLFCFFILCFIILVMIGLSRRSLYFIYFSTEVHRKIIFINNFR